MTHRGDMSHDDVDVTTKVEARTERRRVFTVYVQRCVPQVSGKL